MSEVFLQWISLISGILGIIGFFMTIINLILTDSVKKAVMQTEAKYKYIQKRSSIVERLEELSGSTRSPDEINREFNKLLNEIQYHYANFSKQDLGKIKSAYSFSETYYKCETDEWKRDKNKPIVELHKHIDTVKVLIEQTGGLN